MASIDEGKRSLTEDGDIQVIAILCHCVCVCVCACVIR